MLKILQLVINFFLHPDEKQKDTRVEEYMSLWTLKFKQPELEEAFMNREKPRVIVLFRLQFLLHIVINGAYFINNQFFLKNTLVAEMRMAFTLWHLLLMIIQPFNKLIRPLTFISVSEFLSSVIAILISIYYIEAQLLGKACTASIVKQAVNSGMQQGLIAMTYIFISPQWGMQSLSLTSAFLLLIGLMGNLGSIYWTFYVLIVAMGLNFRFVEYYRRLDFYLIEHQTSNLHACKNIFDKTVPNSILILTEQTSPTISQIFNPKKQLTSIEKEMKLLYCNDFAKQYLNAGQDCEIIQKLRTIFIQQDIESEYSSSEHVKSLYEVIYDKMNSTDSDDVNRYKNQSIQSIQNDYALWDYSEYYLCFKIESTNEVQIPIFPGQKKQHFEIRILPCLWESKLSYLIIINDISEKIRLKHMREIDQYKDRLLATVSHDLKTPLNGMILDINIMQSILTGKNTVSKTQIEELCNHLDEFSQSGQLLLYMINDLLDYSQYNKGLLRLVPKHFSLSTTFRFVNSLLVRQASEKGVKLIFKTDLPNCASQLYNDENRLKQVLLNLVANAIKFTMQGSITVTGNYNEILDLIELDVTDTGYGIPFEIQKKLFRLYSTFDLGNNNRHGVGLGLTISQQLVNVLGPKQNIELISQVGKGSTFRFKIFRHLSESYGESMEDLDFVDKQIVPKFVIERNLKPSISPNHKNHNNHNKSKTYHQIIETDRSDVYLFKKKILIVDDTPFNIIALTGMINQIASVSISKAFNGVQALKLVHQEQFDAIFMDVNMPEMDGYQCTQEIRKYEICNSQKPCTIIMVTAFTNDEDKKKSIKYGANAHLDKPLNIDELKAVLKKYYLVTDSKTNIL